LQAIESVLELPAPDHDGHLIHTPNGPRVAHASHLPVEAAITDTSASALIDTSIVGHDDDGHEAHGADPHADDPHAHTDDPHAHTDDPHAHADDPHAEPAAPVVPAAPVEPAPPAPAPHSEPESPAAPPHSDAPVAPGPPTQAPYGRDGRVLPGYESAHPANLAEEKYAYLNGLAAFAIGPGIFFLGLLVVSTFGLFVYQFKNDPRVF